MDIDTPSRPFSTSSANTLHFGTNTPFIFHSAPRPTSPAYEPYDPSKWASKNFKFGFGGGGQGAEDVEMRFGDSPRGKAEPATAGDAGENENGDERQVKDQGKEKGKSGKVFEVGQPEGEVEERKIASGAMTRVRRKRQKEKQFRNQRGSDSEPEEVSPAALTLTQELTCSARWSRGNQNITTIYICQLRLYSIPRSHLSYWDISNSS
jgi:hypothetical protein